MKLIDEVQSEDYSDTLVTHIFQIVNKFCLFIFDLTVNTSDLIKHFKIKKN